MAAQRKLQQEIDRCLKRVQVSGRTAGHVAWLLFTLQ